MSLWCSAFWEAYLFHTGYTLGDTIFARMEHGTGAYGRPQFFLMIWWIWLQTTAFGMDVSPFFFGRGRFKHLPFLELKNDGFIIIKL